jgi:hypothetical protein
MAAAPGSQVSWLHMLMDIRYESLPPPKQASWMDVLGPQSSTIAGDISWSDVFAPNVMTAPRRRNSHAVIVNETKNKVTQSDARFLGGSAEEKDNAPTSSIFAVSGNEDSDYESSDSEDAEAVTKQSSGTVSAGSGAAAPVAGAATATGAAGTSTAAPTLPGAPAAVDVPLYCLSLAS